MMMYFELLGHTSLRLLYMDWMVDQVLVMFQLVVVLYYVYVSRV